MMFQDVCRLCLGKQELLWVFDEKLTNNMTDIIAATSGVTIEKTDTVSQKVCSTCCQITIKMYQFRTTSIKNDKDLKARCADYNLAQLKSSIIQVPVKKDAFPTKQSEPKYKYAHFSIKKLMRKYPNLKLPVECLQSHVGVYITLLSDEVDDWYKKRNYSDYDIAKFKTKALENVEASKLEKLTQKRKSVESSSEIELQNRLMCPKKTKLSASAPLPLQSVDMPTNRPPSPINVSKRISLLEPNKKLVMKDAEKSTQISNIDSRNKLKISKPLLLTLLSDTHKGENEKTKNTNSTIQTQKNIRSRTKPVILDSDSEVELEPTDHTKVSISVPKPQESEKKIDEELVLSDSISTSSLLKPNIPENANKSNEDLTLFRSRSLSSLTRKNMSSNAISVPNNTDIEIGSDSDRVSIGIESRSSSSLSHYDSSLDISIQNGSNNMPDLSLIAVAQISHKLYTCKVCDSHHCTLKDLKNHEKKVHTKCPFCNKRFKSLTYRDEHIAKSCSINYNPAEMKLVLTRVDEIQEVRQKYSNAFENNENSSPEVFSSKSIFIQTKQTPNTSVIDHPVEPVNDIQDSSFSLKNSEDDVIFVPIDKIPPTKTMTTEKTGSNKDIVSKNNVAKLDIVSSESSLNKNKSNKSPAAARDTIIKNITDKNTASNEKKRGQDVICISDEETDAIKDKAMKKSIHKFLDKQVSYKKKPEKINIVNPELIANININDTDANILKAVLRRKHLKKAMDLKSSPQYAIVDGATNRMKILKNLKPLLENYKIPIRIGYAANVSVMYEDTNPPRPGNLNALWNKSTPIELKNPISTKTLCVPISPPKQTVLNGHVSLLKSNRIAHTPTRSLSNVISNHRLPLTTPDGPSKNYLLAFTSKEPSPATVAANKSLTPTNTNMNFTNYYLFQTPQRFMAPANNPLPVIQSVAGGMPINTSQSTLTNIAELESITNALMPKTRNDNGHVNNMAHTGINSSANMPTGRIPSSTNCSSNPGYLRTSTTTTQNGEKRTFHPIIRVKNFKDLS